MVFVGMEGKLHLYQHGHQVELHALENVVQTLLDGPFNHEDLLWEVVIRYIRMQQGPRLVEVAFIPTIQMLDFIAGGGKYGGRCHFLCKKCILRLDNNLQQLRIDSAFEFSRFKF
jgi:hypothetical protein